MLKHVLLLVLLLAVCSPQVLLAQDTGVPDTVYYGDHGTAYAYPGGIYRVPIYLATDQEIIGVNLGMEYGLGDLSPVYDSLGFLGTIFMQGNYFDLLQGGVNLMNVDGVMPDTIAIGGVGMVNPIPLGSYLLYNVWFTGGSVGQYATVDSVYHTVAGDFVLAPVDGNYYTPQFIGGTLELVAPPPEFFFNLPDSVVGDAATLITFDVEIYYATYPPVTIVLDSIVNTGTSELLPYLPATSGTNPLTVEWTPTYEEYGTWKAWFTATDAELNNAQFPLLIKVNFVQPPCDVLRGDANCDEIIDISDAVLLIQYIFNQGPPPGCGEE